jgi:hypothetical protein
MQDVQKEKQLKWEILTIRMALKKGYSQVEGSRSCDRYHADCMPMPAIR